MNRKEFKRREMIWSRAAQDNDMPSISDLFGAAWFLAYLAACALLLLPLF